MKSFSNLKNKNILITGITGFIGSNLSKKLTEIGANVFGISRSNQNDYIEKIDLQNLEELDRYMKEKKITICFHLAGESIVESGQKHPHNTFQSNILSTLNILETAKINNLEKIIISSSAHVYGKHTPPCTELDIPKPSIPYETSKLCADLISQSYATTYGLPIFIPRFVNVYGPGDANISRLIPNTINSILLDKNPTMWGGKALRDYIYIDDVVSAYLHLACANKNIAGNKIIFNFGSNNIVSVSEVITTLIDVSGKNLKIVRIPSNRDNEITKQYVSWDKANKLLGWSPNVSLDKGLALTYQWYKNQIIKKEKDGK